MTDRELMQQAFERMTGIANAWTNPALMQARNGFIQGWEAARLAQSEPVAWEYCGALFYDKEEVFAWHERGDIGSTPPKPLYSAPPQRKPWDNKVPITDEYERGVIDGMQKQMQSSVDKAVNKLAQREWQGLTDDERTYLAWESNNGSHCVAMTEAMLKEKNSAT